MVHESLDGTLRHLLEVSALVLGAGALTLLALAFGAELLRRRGRAPALLSALDRCLPRPARATALAVLAMVATVTGPATAGADGSVRDWLHGAHPPSTTVSTAAPATTTTTTGTLPTTATAPTPPPPVPSAPAPAPAPAPDAPAALGGGERYVVAPGDCLWSIARARLGAAATNAAVDGEWRAIYAANRPAVGDDPNLIHPGLLLTLPPLSPGP